MSQLIDLSGQRFGRWFVLGKTESIGDVTMWLCECDCGTVKAVRGNNLKSGKSQSCGCLQKEVVAERSTDKLEGKRFGKIFVLGKVRNKDGLIRWKCQCDCGEVFVSRGVELKAGRSTCYKCAMKALGERKQADLRGKRFGMLTPIEPTTKRIHRSTVWLCECDCGHTVPVTARELIAGDTTSCGCTKESKRVKQITELLVQNYYPFTKEKSFDTCRFPDTDRTASFDFYIANSYLLEVDGEQHFRPINKNADGMYGENNYRKLVRRDRFKDEWCKENNIPLIRIPYTLQEVTIEDLTPETSKYLVN